jgi:hypothetical protein
MKRILSIFILLFLLLNTFGTIGYYYYHKAGIRSEMKALMKSNFHKDKIEILKIAKDSKYFQRIHCKEFRYHGKMYDVIRVIPAKDFTIYYCINDEKEERLMESFSKLFETSDDGMATVKYSGKILKNIFFPLFIEKDRSIVSNHNTDNKYYNLSDKCIRCFYDVEIPPPKLIF